MLCLKSPREYRIFFLTIQMSSPSPSPMTRQVINALTVGAVHGAIDHFGVIGQPISALGKQGLMRMGQSAASELGASWLAGSCLLSDKKEQWVQPLVSAVAYPVLSRLSEVDGRSMAMQFILQLGSSFVGEMAYDAALKKWMESPGSGSYMSSSASAPVIPGAGPRDSYTGAGGSLSAAP